MAGAGGWRSFEEEEKKMKREASSGADVVVVGRASPQRRRRSTLFFFALPLASLSLFSLLPVCIVETSCARRVS